MGVSDIAWREWADCDTSQQITDNRRQPDPDRGKATDKGECQPDRDRRDQFDFVRHSDRAKGAETQADIIGDPGAAFIDQHRPE